MQILNQKVLTVFLGVHLVLLATEVNKHISRLNQLYKRLIKHQITL
jgi:hypothetical protein